MDDASPPAPGASSPLASGASPLASSPLASSPLASGASFAAALDSPPAKGAHRSPSSSKIKLPPSSRMACRMKFTTPGSGESGDSSSPPGLE